MGSHMDSDKSMEPSWTGPLYTDPVAAPAQNACRTRRTHAASGIRIFYLMKVASG